MRDGIESAIARGLAYAPYADLLWFETSTPDIEEAETFADEIHAQFPGKLLAYNCSPSFNWSRHLTSARSPPSSATRGARLPLPVRHARRLPRAERVDVRARPRIRQRGHAAYVELQEREFALEQEGYTATRHQREVGSGYFDQVLDTVTGGSASTLALPGSTEEQQFEVQGAPGLTITAVRRTPAPDGRGRPHAPVGPAAPDARARS